MHVMYLVEPFVARDLNAHRLGIADPDIGDPVRGVSPDRHDRDVIASVDGRRPGYRDVGAAGGAVRRVNQHLRRLHVGFGLKLGFWHWGGLGHCRAHGGQRRSQFLGIRSRDVLAAGVLGDAGKRTGVLVAAKPEPHDVGSETDTALLERCRQGARIAFAAFETIGYQHDRRGLIGLGQGLRRLLDGIRQRRLPGGRDGVDTLEDRLPRLLTRRDKHLDIRAIAALTVPIGH